MINLIIAISLKLFIELLIAVAIVAAVIGILWIWNAINPQSFEMTMKKVARYFK